MAAIRSVARSQFLKGLFSNGSFYRAGAPQAVAVDAERSTYLGSVFNNRRLHSESQAAADNEETHDYEKQKMTAEGGGNTVDSFKDKSEEVKGHVEGRAEEAKDSLKGKSEEVKEHVGGRAEEATGEAKDQVSKNVDTAKDMFSDFPQKVSETATGLKEVGVEAGKAIKRDATKVVEKAGLKSE